MAGADFTYTIKRQTPDVPPDARCETCRWYKDNPIGRCEGMKPIGECRIYAPGQRHHWPEVEPSDVCGDWQGRIA